MTTTIVKTSWGGEIEVCADSGVICLRKCDKFIVIKENAGVPGLIGPDISIDIDEVVKFQIDTQHFAAFQTE